MTNWWARAGCERIWVSVVELGVEVSERRASRGLLGLGCASSSGVPAMSPGATVYWLAGAGAGLLPRGNLVVS